MISSTPESTGRIFFSTSSMGPGRWAIFSLRSLASLALFSLNCVACREGSACVSDEQKEDVHLRSGLRSVGLICHCDSEETQLDLSHAQFTAKTFGWSQDCWTSSNKCRQMNKSPTHSAYPNTITQKQHGKGLPSRMCIRTNSERSGLLLSLCFRKVPVWLKKRKNVST